MGRNEMDTHADTSCAGANWKLMELSNTMCEVSPFLDSYQPVQEVPLARCGTVWTSQETGREYLLVGDQMLWFGNKLQHSLINPNQIREYGIDVFDNPFGDRAIGIAHDESFIPFDTKGTVVHFESRHPTEWEEKHLPIILLSGDRWDPSTVQMGYNAHNREQAEMHTIRSLTSGMNRKQVSKVKREQVCRATARWGEVEKHLCSISPAYDYRIFCERMIYAVKIATAYREDMDAQVSGVMTNDRHSKVTPEELSRKWNIGIDTAKKTLEVTTQKGVRTAVHPMTRRMRVDHLQLHRPLMKGTWHVDTLSAKVKSRNGNTCANVFTQGKYVKVIPMTAKSDAGKSLVDFTDDVGIPETLVTDGAGEFTGRSTEFVKEARRMRIKLHTTEQGRKNQNHAAEREIGFLAKRWKLRMRKKCVPKRLWDYGLVYESEILTRMSRGADGRSGYEEVTGETPDISEWLDFEFYDIVWWWDRHQKPDITDESRRLARWLGISHRVGSDMCYWLLTESGKVISKTSVEHVTREDTATEDGARKVKDFNSKLEERLDDTNFQTQPTAEYGALYLEDTDDGGGNSGVTANSDLSDGDGDERPDDDDKEAVDKYINMELIMDLGTSDERRGRVTQKVKGTGRRNNWQVTR